MEPQSLGHARRNGHEGRSFLDLPAEMRNRIYDLALTVPQTSPKTPAIYVRGVWTRRDNVSMSPIHGHQPCYACSLLYSWIERKDITVNLLAVNRLIHKEATSVFYGGNIFHADTISIQLFILQIGPSAAYLRRLVIPDLFCFGGDLHNEEDHPGLCLNNRPKFYLPNLPQYYLLSYAVNLEELWLCLSWMPGHQEGLSICLLGKLYHWIEAVGKAHGDRFVAANRIHFIADEMLHSGGPIQWRVEESKLEGFRDALKREIADGG